MTNAELEQKYALPEPLQVTPERLKEWDAQQKELAAKFSSPFLSLSPREAMRNRAAMLIEDGTITGSELAESYAMLGRYDRAMEVDPDPQRKAEYKQIWDAIWREDDEWCDCGNFKGGLKQTRKFTSQMVWSLKHNKEMPLIKCQRCGIMNVQDEPIELKRMREHRNSAISKTKNMDIAQTKLELSRVGHTAEKLLK